MGQISPPSPNTEIVPSTSVVDGQKITPARGDDAGLTPTCVTNLVFDEPGTGDEFGPHQRIADAIAAVIDEGDKSVAIGLEGAWGSGKTTVVNLLRRALGDRQQDYAVINFDAWAHEGDPLRRTFLESVIEQLNEKQAASNESGYWIDLELWKTKLDEVAKRRTVEENKNLPKLGRWDKALIISLFFVPLGNALLGSALREDVTIRWSGALAWKFLWQFPLGLLFIMAPLAVILWHRYWKEERWDTLNIWTLLTSKGVSESRTETYKTPEPTSLEFENAFLELTKEALENKDRKIILVIDNLDRVDADDALTIWSTLQTFLQHKPGDKYRWLNRLWTVVLYDPRGLSALWPSAGDGTGLPTGNVYKSFVDKTFQLRFEVPAPVLSEWRHFLMKNLQDAFPDHSEEWHTVYRVRALHASNRPPTARELKLFVNQIGALHRQWARGTKRAHDEYPLPHIACYVILSEASGNLGVSENLIDKLRVGKLPDQNDKNLLGPDISRSLAGLAFNIERDRGYQMLLEGPIKTALMEDGAKDVGTWAENSDGFWEVLENIVSHKWFGDDPLLIANAAKVLEQSGVLSTQDRHEVKTVENDLCSSAERVSLWPIDETGRAEGLSTLCCWRARRGGELEAEKFAKTIIKAMTGWLLQDSHTRSVDFAEWIRVADLIAGEVSSAKPPSIYEEGIVTPIGNLFKSRTHLSHSQVYYSLQLLFELADQSTALPGAVVRLNTLASSGDLLKHLRTSADPSDFLRALCLMTILEYHPGGFAGIADDEEVQTFLSDTFGNPPAELPGKFTDLLAKRKRLGLLLDMQDGLSFAKPFVARCIKYIAKEKVEYAESLLPPDVFMQRYRDIWRSLEAEESNEETRNELKRNLTSHVIANTDLIKHITGGDFDEKRHDLYEAMYAASEDNAFKSWCYNRLKAVDEIHWETSLRREQGWFDLLIRLGQPAEGEKLGIEFGNALLKCGRSMIRGTLDPKRPLLWQKLPAALGTSERTPLRTGLLSSLIVAHGGVSDKFFEAFGEEISDRDLLNGQPTIFSNVLVPIVKKKNPKAIKWLATILPHIEVSRVIPGDLQGVMTFRDEVNSLKSPDESSDFDDDRTSTAALRAALQKFLEGADPASGILIQQ